MSNKSRYWFTLSVLLAAVVITVGFAPVPLIFVLGGLLIVGFIAAGMLYGQFQKDAIRSGALTAVFPVIAAIVAFNLALLLRGNAWAGILVPVLAAALFVSCFLWSRKHGPYVPPTSGTAA
ncbi:hypothetical protein BIU82_07175 [Arthrobacter sp. SW1]|uniref:hypothetical protein n=1 Tax=Arthrobacter sp. SW1 TaxID=1920889 RepID=UPI000877D3CF|nr:hypothetical protein [Arthrobacter sp. SW1]OFI37653.1 hypothetical protein BIU82_07175 [Arthrobacter sp. SW1]